MRATVEASGDKTSVFNVNPLLKDCRIEQPDLHLKPRSPAKKSGIVNSYSINGMYDIDGDNRISKNRINKGADQ